ncbi:MAG: YheT family hydrolase [Cyanobacteriota bacterium]
MADLLETLELAPFRQRFPWLGPDLQTLRDSLRPFPSPPETGGIHFALPDGGRLFARLDVPALGPPRGLVVVVHGLGGSSDDGGQRRLGRALQAMDLAVLRLNLRGAGPGRPLAAGTYAAGCSADLLPVLEACRQLATELAGDGPPLPLAGVGISLGGTVLLNALLDCGRDRRPPPLDAMVGVSSPLDLAHCADHFERPRNRLYQSWMVRRLIQQTLNDPLPLSIVERTGLTGSARPRTIREFDALITAPRWGFADVATYYASCSPLSRLRQLLDALPVSGDRPGPLLLVHAMDDPWVPVAATRALAEASSSRRLDTAASCWPDVVLTPSGGHCGFHAAGDHAVQGRWSDRLVGRWLRWSLKGSHCRRAEDLAGIREPPGGEQEPQEPGS